MDPNACLALFFDAANDYAATGQSEYLFSANDAHQDLRDWLTKGGFEPKWTPEIKSAFYSWKSGKFHRGS